MKRASNPAAAAPRRLLVVIDPAARSQPALAKAARLARAGRARVELYACDGRGGPADAGGAGAAARRRLEAGEARLRALARRYQRGRPSEVCCELGEPRAERILARIRRYRPDLVVLDARVRPAAPRALFGPAGWPLIRDCPAPLLYARPGRWHGAPRIAAAVDPLHPADPRARLDAAIVARARALARRLGGSLAVVHAWLPVEPAFLGPAVLGLPVGAPAAVAGALAAAEAGAARALARLCRAGGRPRARGVLLRGAAVETLPGYAKAAGLDVLALGAVSRGRLYAALIGSTAERLLPRVPCDLLIVKARRPPAARPPAAGRDGRRRIPV